MDNVAKPKQKPQKPGPTPGEVYEGVADIVARLRAGIILSQDAGIPVPLDFRPARYRRRLWSNVNWRARSPLRIRSRPLSKQ